MQNKKHSKNVKSIQSNSHTDNDISSDSEYRKSKKFRPVIKALVVVAVLMSATWGASAYFVATDKDTDSNSTSTLSSNDRHKSSQDTTANIDAEITDGSAQDSESSIGSTTQRPSSPDNNTSTPESQPHNTNKCEQLNSEVGQLRLITAQKQKAYANHFASIRMYDSFFYEVRMEYGYHSGRPYKDEVAFFDNLAKGENAQYNNNIAVRDYGYTLPVHKTIKDEADRRYNAMHAQSDLLKADWKSALSKENAVNSKHQECRASL